MKSILLVDDDPLILKLYQTALKQRGFAVEAAENGLLGVAAMRRQKPDAIVLDLMMPTFNGVDVLKFLRGEPSLSSIPVIVLSNSYMGDLAQEAAKLGVQKALLKVTCNPRVLEEAINEVLEGKPAALDPSLLLAAPASASAAGSARPERPANASAEPAPTSSAAGVPAQPKAADADFDSQARSDFLAGAADNCSALRSLHAEFLAGPTEKDRLVRLGGLYRKVHFISAAAGLARCQTIVLMASAFEAMLFEVMGNPSRLSLSVLRTIETSIQFLIELLKQAGKPGQPDTVQGRVLVVDDDPLTCRLAVSALRVPRLDAQSCGDPARGLRLLRETPHALVLLDIKLPGMDGFEFHRQMKALPGYAHTPVIYITQYADFANPQNADLLGGNDLVSKPVFPIELAVKAVEHLLRAQLRHGHAAGS